MGSPGSYIGALLGGGQYDAASNTLNSYAAEQIRQQQMAQMAQLAAQYAGTPVNGVANPVVLLLESNSSD